MRQHIRKMIEEARQRERHNRPGGAHAFAGQIARGVISTARTAAAVHLARQTAEGITRPGRAERSIL